MDLSKLPKLSGRDGGNSSSPVQAPAGQPTNEHAPTGHIPMAGQIHAANVGPHAPPAMPRDALFSSPGGILISAVIGIIFVFLGMSFLKWLAATATGQPFDTGVRWMVGPAAGQPVAYWDLQGGTAWTDCGMALFGVSALIDALAAAICLRTANGRVQAVALTAGFGATAVATLVNAVVCVKLFSLGILPIFSLLALAIGGYILSEQYPVVFRKKTGSATQY